MRSTIVMMATVLMFGLGCGGALDAVADLAGIEMSMQTGDSAVHPADFPATPPEAGKKVFSMSLVTEADSVNLPDEVDVPLEDGAMYKTEMITYQVPSDVASALVATAKEQTLAAGYEDKPVDEQPEESEVVLLAKGSTMFIIVGSKERNGEETALVLMRIQPAPESDEAASPE